MVSASFSSESYKTTANNRQGTPRLWIHSAPQRDVPQRGELATKQEKEHGQEEPCGGGTAMSCRTPVDPRSGCRRRLRRATTALNRGCHHKELLRARTGERGPDPVEPGSHRIRQGSTLRRSLVIRRKHAPCCQHKRRSPCLGRIRAGNARRPAPTGVQLIRSLLFSRYASPQYWYSFGSKRSISNPLLAAACPC